MDRIPEKVCTKCGLGFPATTEFFATCSGGRRFRGSCRACARAYAQIHHEQNAEVRQAYQRDRYHRLNPSKPRVKKCRRCLQIFPSGTLHFGGQGKNTYCRACGEAANMAAREASKALAVAPERACSKCGVVRPNTLEHFYKESRGVCKDCAKERSAQYAKANPAVIRASHNNRRARKKAAGGRFGKADVLVKLKQQGNACHWCRAPLDKGYHVDHVIPLAKGGTNGPENIACACSACNLSKGAKMPWEFANRLF